MRLISLIFQYLPWKINKNEDNINRKCHLTQITCWLVLVLGTSPLYCGLGPATASSPWLDPVTIWEPLLVDPVTRGEVWEPLTCCWLLLVLPVLVEEPETRAADWDPVTCGENHGLTLTNFFKQGSTWTQILNLLGTYICKVRLCFLVKRIN